MRLSHATLFVSDLARSRAFYLRLGFTLVVDEAHYCRFIVGGDTTLSIEKRENVKAGGADFGIEFESAAALDGEITRLAAAGVEIAETPVGRSWLWRDARVVDPDGHELLYFFAGQNKLDPPWRVKS
jgi:catechol 2,3-dioxygenase-like lactoylglutathione lyase family enzyme